MRRMSGVKSFLKIIPLYLYRVEVWAETLPLFFVFEPGDTFVKNYVVDFIYELNFRDWFIITED